MLVVHFLLGALIGVGAERQVYGAAVIPRVAGDAGDIELGEAALFKLAAEMALGTVMQAHDADARGVLVEPVHEACVAVMGPGAGGEAILEAGAVAGHHEKPALLVEHEDVLVLMENVQIGLHGRRVIEAAQAGGRLGGSLGRGSGVGHGPS